MASTLKDKEAEVLGLRNRLQAGKQQLRSAFDQMAESEVLFRDAIKAAEARSVELKSEISTRDVSLLRQTSEIYVLESEIKRLRDNDEVHKSVEDTLLAEIKSLKLRVAELEDDKCDYEELQASIVSMEEERAATIEEMKDLHTDWNY
jgi:chromosome segregation ATPase